MRHTVLMPFSRIEHFDTLREHLQGQGVEWRLLCDQVGDNWTADWIKPWQVTPRIPRKSRVDENQVFHRDPTVNAGNWCIDRFLDWALANEPEFFSTDHYVSFQTDDCLWSWNYYRKLQRCWGDHLDAKPRVVISACMSPGGNIVPAVLGRQPGRPCWENDTCRCFVTRLEALTVRADLLRDKRLGRLWCGDGILVERLVEENAGAVACFNEGLIYFNALRPECWGFPADRPT